MRRRNWLRLSSSSHCRFCQCSFSYSVAAMDAMQIQLDLRVHERRRQQIGRVGAHAARQLPGDVLGLVGCQAGQNGINC